MDNSLFGKFILSENQKEWLVNLFRENVDEYRCAASNNHLAALGSEGEEASMFEANSAECTDFANILEDLACEAEAYTC